VAKSFVADFRVSKINTTKKEETKKAPAAPKKPPLKKKETPKEEVKESLETGQDVSDDNHSPKYTAGNPQMGEEEYATFEYDSEEEAPHQPLVKPTSYHAPIRPPPGLVLQPQMTASTQKQRNMAEFEV